MVTWVQKHTENIFEILLNQTEIRLYLPFPIDLEPNERPFGTKSVEKW